MRGTILALPLSLLLAGCEQASDPRGVGEDEVLLQVVASGRADTRPDEARFTAGVQTIAGSAAAASAGNNAAMNRVTQRSRSSASSLTTSRPGRSAWRGSTTDRSAAAIRRTT